MRNITWSLRVKFREWVANWQRWRNQGMAWLRWWLLLKLSQKLSGKILCKNRNSFREWILRHPSWRHLLLLNVLRSRIWWRRLRRVSGRLRCMCTITAKSRGRMPSWSLIWRSWWDICRVWRRTTNFWVDALRSIRKLVLRLPRRYSLRPTNDCHTHLTI